jgi:hypothetical protein
MIAPQKLKTTFGKPWDIGKKQSLSPSFRYIGECSLAANHTDGKVNLSIFQQDVNNYCHR